MSVSCHVIFFQNLSIMATLATQGENSLEKKKQAGVRMQDLDVEQKEVGVFGMQKSVGVSCRGLRFVLR